MREGKSSPDTHDKPILRFPTEKELNLFSYIYISKWGILFCDGEKGAFRSGKKNWMFVFLPCFASLCSAFLWGVFFFSRPLMMAQEKY
jgi:hypothetical protein